MKIATNFASINYMNDLRLRQKIGERGNGGEQMELLRRCGECRVVAEGETMAIYLR